MRNYRELSQLATFDERFDYLKIGSTVGLETFGSHRWQNQRFYHSKEWRHICDYVVSRDNGCDLGCPDRPIAGKIIVHHMIPLTVEALEHGDDTILDPDYLISCSLPTHNDIHYGKVRRPSGLVERRPFDTSPWRQ